MNEREHVPINSFPGSLLKSQGKVFHYITIFISVTRYKYSIYIHTHTHIYLYMYIRICIYQSLMIYKADTAHLITLTSSKGMETKELCVCMCVLLYLFTYFI